MRRLLATLLLCGVCLPAVDYYSPDNIRRFAEHLYASGDYVRAASEFQRYLFSSSEPAPDADEITYRIALCFRLAKEYPRAIAVFEQAIRDYPQSRWCDACHLQLAYTYHLMGRFTDSQAYLTDNLPRVSGPVERLKLSQLGGLNFLSQRHWTEAIRYFDSLDAETRAHPMTVSLAEMARQGLNLPRKSRILAGLMSAVIPGSGKVYAGRKWDALASLLTIAVTAWQAYDGFHDQGLKSTKGWIYGLFGTFLYLGNIYGSVVAVKIFNQQQEKRFVNKVGFAIGVYFN